MNKNDLIKSVAEKSELNNTQALRAVDAVFEAVTQALGRGEEVRLVGFGTFDVTERKARSGRNPRTGAPLKIAASKAPRFKAGLALREAVSSA